MAFKLQAITMTSAIGESAGKSRYVYVDKKAGQTMTLLEPLYATDDVDALLRSQPTRRHTTKGQALLIVTTWRKPRPSSEGPAATARRPVGDNVGAPVSDGPT